MLTGLRCRAQLLEFAERRLSLTPFWQGSMWSDAASEQEAGVVVTGLHRLFAHEDVSCRL